MKQFSIRLAACALSAALLLSLAACSGSNASSQGSAEGQSVSSAAEGGEGAASQAESASSEESSAEESSESGMVGGKYASIADFVNSDIMQSQFESMKSSLGTDTMDIDLVGEGNKLIYNFSYLDLGDQDLEALGTALASALDSDSMKSTFSGIASSLKAAVNVDDPLVVVNYLAPDGTLLASQEFAAE